MFVNLEARLDKIEPARSCLCGLSLRACVMAGAVFMTLAGCVMLVHSPMSMVGTFRSLVSQHNTQMSQWAFVYVHVYLIVLHLLTTCFLLYAVPLSVLALRSAYQYEATYLRSYFRMNVQVVGLLVLGSLFNLMLDNTLCDMQRQDPFGAGYVTGATGAGSLHEKEDCSFGANALKLLLSVSVACVYVYLAWLTYCFRRELEQGTQLDDDVAAMAEAASAGMHKESYAPGEGGWEGERRRQGVELPVRSSLGQMHEREREREGSL